MHKLKVIIVNGTSAMKTKRHDQKPQDSFQLYCSYISAEKITMGINGTTEKQGVKSQVFGVSCGNVQAFGKAINMAINILFA